MPRTLPDALHEWSKPTAKDRQPKPSEELQVANEKIRALRKKHPRRKPQQLLEKYYRESVERETLLA